MAKLNWLLYLYCKATHYSFSSYKSYLITDQTKGHFLYDSLNIKPKVQKCRTIHVIETSLLFIFAITLVQDLRHFKFSTEDMKS